MEQKVANAATTRLESGCRFRDGDCSPAASSPAVSAAQMQNSRMLAAVSTALAAFRVNVEKPYDKQPAADVEDVPFHRD